MFTGIIKSTVKIKHSETKDGSLFLTVHKPENWELIPGASIATNGVCLTVREIFNDSYTTELMPTTLAITTFGKSVPEYVNLEPSLAAGEPMDGHIVSGHVDSLGMILSIEKGERSWQITISFPKEFSKLVVPKGSITINGVSLTVAECTDDTLTVNLVDYTISHTTFEFLNTGDLVNLEYDIVGKYIAKHYGNN